MRSTQPYFFRLFNLGSLELSINILLIIAFLALLIVPVAAQKKKPRTTQKGKTPATVVAQVEMQKDIVEALGSGCVPPAKDFLAIVQIDKSSKAKVTFDTKSQKSLDEILSNISSKPVITVKADPSLDYGSVAKVLYDTRRITDDCINIEASTNSKNPYVYYLPEPMPETSVNVKPNPLSLIVLITADGKISLNTENLGSVSDTAPLTKQLKEIFAYRIAQGIYREGTNEIETSVVVKPSSSVKFSEVIKVIDAIKVAEASPVGLIIDGLQP